MPFMKIIGEKRIFLVEPKSLQTEKKEKLKDSRLDFQLKQIVCLASMLR